MTGLLLNQKQNHKKIRQKRKLILRVCNVARWVHLCHYRVTSTSSFFFRQGKSAKSRDANLSHSCLNTRELGQTYSAIVNAPLPGAQMRNRIPPVSPRAPSPSGGTMVSSLPCRPSPGSSRRADTNNRRPCFERASWKRKDPNHWCPVRWTSRILQLRVRGRFCDTFRYWVIKFPAIYLILLLLLPSLFPPSVLLLLI